MNIRTIRFLAILLLSIGLLEIDASSLNIVVFSYDRPLQLYAFLESLTYYTTGCARLSIIYKTSSEKFDEAYATLKKDFPAVEWYKQASYKGANDFKNLLIEAIGFEREDYIAFAVDDIIITRPIDFNAIINILNVHTVNGFYLRMGRHITSCYSENRQTGTPPFIELADSLLAWRFNDGTGDWGYPHTVDMTVYKKSLIHDTIIRLSFTNPNTLEGTWAMVQPAEPIGLCYEHAMLVNCPLNIVQTTYRNRHADLFSAKELLRLFLKGYKIDITQLEGVYNTAPHMAYAPHFIPRTDRLIR